jgi:AraC-like DNA-binding protein
MEAVPTGAVPTGAVPTGAVPTGAVPTGAVPGGTRAGERSIAKDERSGVLHPANLERYNARWFAPHPDIAEVVEHFWHVRWRLDPGETIPQQIIAAPAITLSIEEGDVPARLVVTGVYGRAWSRDIRGWGEVLGIRLRPAGLAVLSDLTPDAVADATLPVTKALDAPLHAMMAAVAEGAAPTTQVDAATDLIRNALRQRPLGAEQRLANAVVAELTARVHTRAGSTLAERFGVSERTIQRALQRTLGQGPKWVSRWVRLQEVARRLAVDPDADVSAVAAELGYSDQAHLVNDFRAAVGTTPGAYGRSLRELTGGS